MNDIEVRLLAVATAVPDHVIDQRLAADRARMVFEHRMRNYDRLSEVFASTGIDRRYSVCQVDWFMQPRGWRERTAEYLRGACSLYERVVRDALEQAGVRPDEVNTVVTVSSTGVATPSLEARVLPGLGFRARTQRVPVFGLGCAGGVSGLALAALLARAQPGAVVLLVCVELCTLAFRLDKATKVDVIATALFGDGAAAAVLRADEASSGIAILTAATEHLWPSTLDIMGWRTDDIGFGVQLSRSLPAFVRERYGVVLEEACAHMGMSRETVDRVVCHPGGAKVLVAIEEMLGLDAGSLDHERTVMRDFGNMSSPTVLFVLKRLLAAGLPENALLAALGPGFTASFLALRAVS